MTSWQCGGCGRWFASWIGSCGYCGPKVVSASNTSGLSAWNDAMEQVVKKWTEHCKTKICKRATELAEGEDRGWNKAMDFVAVRLPAVLAAGKEE